VAVKLAREIRRGLRRNATTERHPGHVDGTATDFTSTDIHELQERVHALCDCAGPRDRSIELAPAWAREVAAEAGSG
jgi:hypothetical protein